MARARWPLPVVATLARAYSQCPQNRLAPTSNMGQVSKANCKRIAEEMQSRPGASGRWRQRPRESEGSHEPDHWGTEAEPGEQQGHGHATADDREGKRSSRAAQPRRAIRRARPSVTRESGTSRFQAAGREPDREYGRAGFLVGAEEGQPSQRPGVDGAYGVGDVVGLCVD